MISVKEVEVDFNTLEVEIFDFVCLLGIKLLGEFFQNIDNQLRETRDKSVYRHKGLRKTSIKTVMGTVEFGRAIYETINENGKKKYIYLLDEYLKFETIGKMSTNLIEKVVQNATICSFRRAADNVSDLTGQSISHSAVWNLIQTLGSEIGKKEEEKVQKYKDGLLDGKRESNVIFEEADGLWLSMQGYDRPKKGRKREIKLGVSYEGWRRRSGQKEAYEVVNKKVVSGFMKPEEFKYLRDTSLAETYRMDEISFRILNGDGASWIKNGHNCEGDYFQLDKFHIFQAIIRKIPDKKESKNLINLIKKEKLKEFYDRLTELKFECGGELSVVEKIQELEKYLKANGESVLPYQARVTLPTPQEGISYRNLGTMEHNIFDVLGYRMKGHKMSWSIKGANNLSKILATKASGKLYETINNLVAWKLPEKAITEFTEIIKNTTLNIEKKCKKKKFYPVHEAQIPFGDCSKTRGRTAIRKIFNDRLATELVYR